MTKEEYENVLTIKCIKTFVVFESNEQDLFISGDLKSLQRNIHEYRERNSVVARTINELHQEVSDTLEERIALEYQLEQLKSFGDQLFSTQMAGLKASSEASGVQIRWDAFQHLTVNIKDVLDYHTGLGGSFSPTLALWRIIIITLEHYDPPHWVSYAICKCLEIHQQPQTSFFVSLFTSYLILLQTLFGQQSTPFLFFRQVKIIQLGVALDRM